MDGKIVGLALTLSLALTGCSFNPFTTENHLTGSALSTGIGAGAGVGAAALLGATKPVPLIAGGAVGGIVGYYVSTLRFASGGIVQGGGQVFTLGEYAAIEIPTDSLFDTNSADFLDDASPILDSAVAVLKRYPDNNIIISGNTSGFGTAKFERKLSQDRARQVSAYLWAHGISEWKFQSLKTRKLIYVGYGSYFPIANNIRNDSIRQNSRIQITAYPTAAQLEIEKKMKTFNNIGSLDEPRNEEVRRPVNFGNQFSEAIHEEASSQRNDYKDVFDEGNVTNTISPAASRHTNYYQEQGDLKSETVINTSTSSRSTTHYSPRAANLKDEDVWGNYK